MAIRTVRLDDEAEAALREIREATGVSISEALKQGLRSLKQQVRDASRHHPYALYERLDLGPGGYAIAPSTETRRGVVAALRKKLRK
jgi:8-oxo-dGTP pyrophosphatase MutT (NUDIX family)